MFGHDFPLGIRAISEPYQSLEQLQCLYSLTLGSHYACNSILKETTEVILEEDMTVLIHPR